MFRPAHYPLSPGIERFNLIKSYADNLSIESNKIDPVLTTKDKTSGPLVRDFFIKMPPIVREVKREIHHLNKKERIINTVMQKGAYPEHDTPPYGAFLTEHSSAEAASRAVQSKLTVSEKNLQSNNDALAPLQISKMANRNVKSMVYAVPFATGDKNELIILTNNQQEAGNLLEQAKETVNLLA